MSEPLGFLLADSTRLFRRAFQARLQGSALTLAQARALVLASRDPGIRQVELADRLDIQPITLARLIDQLAEAGLVERRADPADRRAWQLFVTAAAQPQLDEIRKVSAAIERDATRGMDPATRQAVSAGLATIRTNLAGL